MPIITRNSIQLSMQVLLQMPQGFFVDLQLAVQNDSSLPWVLRDSFQSHANILHFVGYLKIQQEPSLASWMKPLRNE